MLLVSLIAASLFGLSSARSGIVCNAHPKGKPLQPYNCNWRGYISAPRGLSPNTLTYTPLSAGDETRPVIACRNLCYKSPGCKSYSVNNAEESPAQGCTLYTARIRAMKPGPTDPSSPLLFNNIACTTAELAQGFVNPGFETGTLQGWSVLRNSDPSYGIFVGGGNTYGGRSGYVAQMLATGGNEDSDRQIATLYQMASLCPGTTYDVSFDYYIPSGDNTGPNPGTLMFNIFPSSQGPQGGPYATIDLGEADTDVWVTQTKTFTYPADPDGSQLVWTLYSDDESQAAIVIDNFVLTPASVQPAK